MRDPEPTLDEPDTDVEVIHKLRARIEALEAALRSIVDEIEYRSGTPAELLAIARTALDEAAGEAMTAAEMARVPR